MVWPAYGNEWAGYDDIPLLLYDPSADAWSVHGSFTLGYHPPLTIGAGRALRPDRDNPVVTSIR